MRIWHEQLILKLCRQHLLAVWREGLGAYKIITEKRTDLSYYKHPATQEFKDCTEALHQRLSLIRQEMLNRGYNPKELPELISFGGQVKEWQSIDEQINLIKSKGCKCNI